ncbi:MAG: glycine betaine/L-proline ABC transporter substrate-binding protein ProX [Desulfohalobiaceae bacterium]|nr:glycine betaine/L-proline ABC transporter substrate-binding protein ProX [Desulfohalobiaceae bacterium]
MKFKGYLKTIVVGLALTTMLVFAGNLTAADMPGKGTTVQPARATWTTGFFLEALYSRALSDLGYEVRTPKDLSNPIFYQAVTQGDVDYWANGWFPLHDAQLPDNFDAKAEKVGYVAQAAALQGYLASKDLVEKYDIKSLEDFKRDEVKKAFDDNGDGKADLVACPPGWGCEKAITKHMKAYDLGDHINLIKAGYSASMADAVARYDGGGPVFFYTWTPNWTVYKLKPGEDVLWLNVPEDLEGENTDATGIEGAVTDPVKMGFIPNDIVVVANKDFLKDNPAAEKLFEVMSVPIQEIFAQNNKMFEGENKQRDIERHVDEFIAKYETEWNEWLQAARKAAK